MKRHLISCAILALLSGLFATGTARAADLLLETPLQSGVYYGDDITAQTNCRVESGAAVTLGAYQTLRFGPGFTTDGGTLVAKIVGSADTDTDSLPDWWEMEQFGTLSQGSADDFDRDGLTNSQEYTDFLIGMAPTVYEPDHDSDGLRDGDEFEYFGNLSTVGDPWGDQDNDGVSNIAECDLGTDPSVIGDRPVAGYHYQYDSMGRIRKVYAVPAQ